MHYFSLRNFSGVAHGGEVKSTPWCVGVPSATVAFLLQSCNPLSLLSTAQVDRLPPPSSPTHCSLAPPPQRLLPCHLAGTATHALAPSAFITFGFAHICLLDIHLLPV